MRMIARSLVVALFSVLLATACGRASGSSVSSPPGPAAHVFGWVRAEPTCPVERKGHPCPPRPLRAVEIEARSLGGQVVATTQTRADGYYSFQLLPDSYVLVVKTLGVFPRCPHVPVSVRPRMFVVRADVSCDTGIR